jgi:hypothetical protein
MSSLPGQPLDKGTPEPVEMDLQGQSQFTCSICAKIFANRKFDSAHLLSVLCVQGLLLKILRLCRVVQE